MLGQLVTVSRIVRSLFTSGLELCSSSISTLDDGKIFPYFEERRRGTAACLLASPKSNASSDAESFSLLEVTRSSCFTIHNSLDCLLLEITGLISADFVDVGAKAWHEDDRKRRQVMVATLTIIMMLYLNDDETQWKPLTEDETFSIYLMYC
mmetsp:Transcript_12776/g.16693  ORF Transcript_12776/g.16693 Transcript_12776/m.16693 type:complete len:152 (-) Transcript_12776:152-607(-)